MDLSAARKDAASTADFSEVQKQYLAGFFAGVTQSTNLPFVGHTDGGLLTHDPASGVANHAVSAEATVFGTPVSDLCREELWKHEQDPFALWDTVLRYSSEDRAPTDDDRFLLKYHGLFHVAPAQDSFMLRLRIPGGVLRTYALRGLAEIAETWGCGRADITTRANLQLREFAPRHIVRVLTRLQELGLTSRGSGADNIRNITASPISGIDPCELLDVQPFAQAMQHYISNSPDMYKLPRKFNIAFDNGGRISVLADTNDIGFVGVRVPAGRAIPEGVYFRVLLCGITGHKQFASDCGLLIRPDQAVAVAAAMVRVFVQNGDRTDRKKARLKYLVDRWGVERFIQETEKLLAFPVLHASSLECAPRGPIDRAGHIGVHSQSQPNLNYIGVSVDVGRVSASQMRAVAKIADRLGSGEIRLTVWQNFIIPNIASDSLDDAKRALTEAGLAFTAGSVLSGTVACTGNQGCRFAASDTKTHALALARMLDERFPRQTSDGHENPLGILQPVNLHVTGCVNSCAQHYIGDIGLMGVKVGGEEGYQVVLGGGADQDEAIARELIPAIRFSDLPPKIESLFAAYTSRRMPTESFLQFARRHEIPQLQQFCTPTEEAHA